MIDSTEADLAAYDEGLASEAERYRDAEGLASGAHCRAERQPSGSSSSRYVDARLIAADAKIDELALAPLWAAR